MRRPMLFIFLTYALGIYSGEYIELINEKIILFMLILCMLAFFIKKKKYIVLTLIVFVLGNLNYIGHKYYDGELGNFENDKITLKGLVVQQYIYDDKFILKSEYIIDKKKKYFIKENILVKLKEKRRESILGKEIIVEGIIVKSPAKRNPKEFDYRAYLKSKKINSILYARSIEVINKANVLLDWASQTKNYVYEVLENTLPPLEGNLCYGLITGDKSLLNEEIYDNFRSLGISHILAISGLHVGIIYIFVYRITFKKKFIQRLLAGIVFLMYIIVTAYSISIIRAVCMLIILDAASEIERPYDSLCALSFIGFIFILVNPYVLYNSGFLLSFFTVMWIILLHSKVEKLLYFFNETIRKIISVTLSAQLGILPIILYNYNEISIYSLVMNLLGIWILSILMPVILLNLCLYLVMPKASTILAFFILWGSRIIINLAKVFLKMPFSSFLLASPSKIFIITYYVILLIIVYEIWPVKIGKRSMCIIIIGLFFITNLMGSLVKKPFTMTFFHVGQGDCTLITTPHKKNILIDGGPVSEGDDERLLYLLLKNGIRKIDIIILSHSHKDHIGGLLRVADKMTVDNLIFGVYANEIKEFNQLLYYCNVDEANIFNMSRGQSITVEENLSFKCINPSVDTVYKEDDENNNSLSLILDYNDFKCLFTGDIESSGEENILKNNQIIKADLIKVPHHGSNTSSTRNFLNEVNGKIAIIQVGKNFYGHPSKEILKRYDDYGYKVFRTDKFGAIIIKVNDDELNIRTMVR
ncbi:DNA internalization-related competence protein ComEC/Rec2 [Anaeromicrobium sediminis]|uniref:DNA internalization-related competence protein ComEC/Rec2 n=1 Tax=Anaeromicrobium sediminis TaxID=1478221 RepID=A0A267MJJ2_9FIRM|nr:DNA internalization-related competence protein ComEC/Rec2 [Anaeromicrobium sediminis]PAB58950.1 DNA internalization-related competence protein ComEC/Rec2 [Anaeromicrobium sediminis]